VLTEVTREHGEYSSGTCHPPSGTPPADVPASVESRNVLTGMTGRPTPRIPPGVCFPWEEKVKELPEITGDRDLVRKVWNDIEGLANTYIWQVLLSF